MEIFRDGAKKSGRKKSGKKEAAISGESEEASEGEVVERKRPSGTAAASICLGH